MYLNIGIMGLCAVMVAAGVGGVANAKKEKRKQANAAEDYRVGETVDKICFPGTIDGFRPAGRYNDAVLVEEGLNNWYLLTLTGACRSSDFRSSNAIGIDTGRRPGCVRRGDIIVVQSFGHSVNRCFINEIYDWDIDAEEPGKTESEPDDV